MNPFIGIRSFEPAESPLFHGRKPHVQQLLRVLAAHRLVTVTGTSGSGKSSLVKAGLLPALHRGYLRGATTRWRTAVLRPGPAPLLRLGEALAEAQPEAVSTDSPAALAERLGAHSAALIDELQRSSLAAQRENLLLVVDQFEEIFAAPPNEAAAFVALLLRAAGDLAVPLYTVLTMRSEFLGESPRFPGLAQVMSDAQYLVPRLTREQLTEAIRGPLDSVGVAIDDALVQQLLHDAGNDPDQLPALQHALQRLFGCRAPGQPLSLAFYQEHPELAVGRSVHTHAEELAEGLEAGRLGGVFRALTRRDEGGRELRRPARRSHLCAVTGATAAEVDGMVVRFAGRDDALLTCTDERSGDPWVDITHETLIRQWERLKGWVAEEAASADWFRRLVQSARLEREGEAGLWRDPDVATVTQLAGGWNEAWAGQYLPAPAFAEGMAFLAASRRQMEAEAEQQRRQAAELETARQRELAAAIDLAAAREHQLSTANELASNLFRQRQRLSSFLVALLALTAWLVYFAFRWRQEEQDVAKLLAQLHPTDSKAARVNPKDVQLYVYIPPGEFTMGCSAGDSDCLSHENPTHPVRITQGFWLGQTEVTQAAYHKVTGQAPSFFEGDQRPVENVDWYQAASYCQAVGMRLPTEAEWEYAARAGSPGARYGALDDVAWYHKNSGSETKPVGGKKPNDWGLYDMLGNVWEWTADPYDGNSYHSSLSTDPAGPASGDRRVLRGGSWIVDPAFVRVSYRLRGVPTYRGYTGGFRCAGEFR
ncbi:MAG: SUMF1/EgtB/PvdO family nonheme iron enzyme [Acidobacteriaceae bacterium]|nr:SUMF1/EgtB/PvdO family nonheme iron enzyme [Acidobacteriaceae bacterium]